MSPGCNNDHRQVFAFHSTYVVFTHFKTSACWDWSPLKGAISALLDVKLAHSFSETSCVPEVMHQLHGTGLSWIDGLENGASGTTSGAPHVGPGS